MIQVLTYSGKDNYFKGKNVLINSLHDARALDDFDINIINLNDKIIWRYSGERNVNINIIKDFISLSEMLINSKKSNNIILFPQNINYQFYYNEYDNIYLYNCDLKDMIGNMKGILSSLYNNINELKVVYENTFTQINDKSIPASFYFNEKSDNALTLSNISEKLTTLKLQNTILTTLKLSNYNQLIDFLKEIKLIVEKEEVPSWLTEEKMFDDEKQLNIIQEKTSIIEDANDNIKKATEIIHRNERYKSILYTSGDELVDVVFEILEKMVGCDLSSFNDEKKEDFNFEIKEKIFIGEIKGISSNVKNGNVSQLDKHVQDYLDEHEGVSADDIVSLLIIDHQRNKPLNCREQVNSAAIKLAERYGCLIIETITLLKVFEKFINEEMTTEQCIERLSTNKGILTI